MSQLHDGAEIGRTTRGEKFNGMWEAWAQTRKYALTGGGICKVTVFAADNIGFATRHGVTPGGMYRFEVEVFAPEGDQVEPMARCSGVIENHRLRPAMPGELVKTLAWEVALDEADQLLTS